MCNKPLVIIMQKVVFSLDSLAVSPSHSLRLVLNSRSQPLSRSPCNALKRTFQHTSLIVKGIYSSRSHKFVNTSRCCMPLQLRSHTHFSGNHTTPTTAPTPAPSTTPPRAQLNKRTSTMITIVNDCINDQSHRVIQSCSM